MEFEVGQKVEVSDDGVWIVAIIQERSTEEGKWVVKFDGITETKKSVHEHKFVPTILWQS